MAPHYYVTVSVVKVKSVLCGEDRNIKHSMLVRKIEMPSWREAVELAETLNDPKRENHI